MRIPGSISLLVGWFVIIIPCIAAPLQHTSTTNVPLLRQISLIATTHIQHLRTPNKALPEHRPNPQINRRAIYGSNPGSLALGSFQLETKFYKTFTTIVPAELAASYINDFLDIIALRIETGVWGHEPPAKHRVIHMWDFELSFCSLNTAVPWDFIQAYVLEMADDIKKGFVGTFDEYMIGVINGVATAVTVKLKVRTREGPLVLT